MSFHHRHFLPYINLNKEGKSVEGDIKAKMQKGNPNRCKPSPTPPYCLKLKTKIKTLT